MKINFKSEKGAITLIVLVGMLFLTTFLMSMYIAFSNKAQNSAETTKQIAEKYNNIEDAESIYYSYYADTEIIPIYTREQLEKIGSGEQIKIDGKIFTFAPNGYYTLKNDLDLGGYYNSSTNTWAIEDGQEWTPLTSAFTGILDGLGHTITGLYINDSAVSNQGLFGTLKGTVKNINLYGSYIKANEYVGGIAGLNQGTIENCNNKATVIGTNNVGGIAGNLTDKILNCTNTGTIVGTTNVTGGYFKSIETGETIDVWSNNVLAENAYFVSGSYTATAPKGFKVSNNVFEQTIEEGMVIQDPQGNEFVWVPVSVTQADTETSIAAFYRSPWENNQRIDTLTETSFPASTQYKWENFTEPYTGNTWEVEEYNAMVKSVYKNGGFYFGRYESGTSEPRYSGVANGTDDVVVKRDQYPYVWVGCGKSVDDYESNIIHDNSNNSYNEETGLDQGHSAIYLSKTMYGGDSVGVISTLCYGVQWDAMLDFIKDQVDVTNVTNWGNVLSNRWTVNRQEVKYEEQTSDEWKKVSDLSTKSLTSIGNGYLLTTGASDMFKVKNIFDTGGNCQEWTMEESGSWARIFRDSPSGNGRKAACYRYVSASWTCAGASGFRVTLYVK